MSFTAQGQFNRKPRTYEEWRDVYQGAIYDFGVYMESFMQWKWGFKENKIEFFNELHMKKIPLLYKMLHRLKRISARLYDCHEEMDSIRKSLGIRDEWDDLEDELFGTNESD